MEFSEEQLQEVFSQFDAEGDGYIALDQVRTFAEQAGLTVRAPLPRRLCNTASWLRHQTRRFHATIAWAKCWRGAPPWH